MEDKLKKIYSMLAIMALVLSPALLSGHYVDVTGDWEMTTESPRGERTQTIHFEQDGEKLTITMQGGMRGGQGGGENGPSPAAPREVISPPSTREPLMATP